MRGAYIGTDGAGNRCCSDQRSATLLCRGARSGKGSLIIRPKYRKGCSLKRMIDWLAKTALLPKAHPVGRSAETG